MKEYSFLLKPVFFIFSLLFATWLVIAIEKISPSDFGDTESRVVQKPDNSKNLEARKQYLKNLFIVYKAGMIDSAKLDQKLTVFLKFNESAFAK